MNVCVLFQRCFLAYLQLRVCVRTTPAASIAESIQMSGIEFLLSLLMINLKRSPAELLTAAFVTVQEACKATWELRAADSH